MNDIVNTQQQPSVAAASRQLRRAVAVAMAGATCGLMAKVRSPFTWLGRKTADVAIGLTASTVGAAAVVSDALAGSARRIAQRPRLIRLSPELVPLATYAPEADAWPYASAGEVAQVTVTELAPVATVIVTNTVPPAKVRVRKPAAKPALRGGLD